MNAQEIEARFNEIRVWTKGAQRAPHKPLLLLYALGGCARGESRLIPYSQIDNDLNNLSRPVGRFQT